MKNTFTSWMFLGIFAVILAVSCATAPAGEPSPPPAAAPPQPAAPPAAPPATPPAPPAPPVTPSAPSGDLGSLSGEALTRLYSDTENELNRARDAAINAGARVFAPDFLLDADNTVVLALQKYEANDYNAAKSSADEALLMYNVLKDGLDAYRLREELSWSIYELAPDILWQADDVALPALDKWDAKDYNGAKASVDSALLVYNTIRTGLAAYDTREAVAWRVDFLAPDILWQADDVALAALDKWDAKDYDGAKEGADKALLVYNTLAVGLAAYDTRSAIVWRVDNLVPEAIWQADDVAYEALDEWWIANYNAARVGAGMSEFVYDTLGTGLEVYDTREDIALDVLAIEPEALWQADDVAFQAIDRWLYENYYGARAGADRAQFVYDTLGVGLEAYQLREDIALDAIKIDPNAIWRTDDIGWEAVDKWLASDYEGARINAETAMFGYTVAGAAVERQRALDVRADTAVRQEFNAAQGLYARANAALQGQRYNEAALLFRESLITFRWTARTALERRLNAEDAIRRAERRLTESSETARNADVILGGGR